MSSSKKLKIALIAVGALVVLAVGFSVLSFNIDKSLVSSGKDPLFAVRTNGINDGGSEIYSGLGYQMVKWYSFIENTELSKSDYGTFGEYETVYVCGWDMNFGRLSIKNGPAPEHTIQFRVVKDEQVIYDG